MSEIQGIVEALNSPPFNKGYKSLVDFHDLSPVQLLSGATVAPE
jgi:hypothetical protein